jgi:multidrug transporter EmrE-like cation transporter
VIAILSGAIAMAPDRFPGAQTVTTRPGLLVAVAIAVSVTGAAAPGSRLPMPTTYAVWPSGLIAISAGAGPTLIGLPAVLLAARIGVTVFPASFAT